MISVLVLQISLLDQKAECGPLRVADAEGPLSDHDSGGHQGSRPNRQVGKKQDGKEQLGPHSRQSAKLFLYSSELGLTPSPAGECDPPPFARERGWGSPVSDEGDITLWYFIYMYTVCTLYIVVRPFF
jgi:hypothetical protein